MPFYAVRTGRIPGIYNTWDECERMVTGFSGAKFKKFATKELAEEFIRGPGIPSKLVPSSINIEKESFAKRSTPVIVIDDDSNDYRPKAKVAKLESRTLVQAPVIVLDYTVDYRPKTKVPKRESRTPQVQARAMPHVRKTHQQRKGKNKNYLPATTEGDHVVAYTDGACENNGRRGANGGIGVYWGPGNPHNVSEPLLGRQTNNRAEIMAAVKAIEQAKQMGNKKVTIHTDSKFMINGITQWIHRWKKNGWKLSTGGDVKNREDFEELDRECQDIDVNWVHVAGHRGIKGNEEADRLARQGAS